MEKKLLHILVIVALSLPVSAQENLLTDSLKDALRNSKALSEQVQILSALARDVRTSDTVRYLEYMREIHSRSAEEEFAGGLAAYNRGMGELRMYYGHYGNAAGYFEASLAHYLLDQDYIGHAHALVDLGNVSLYLSDYDAALLKYKSALQEFEKHGNIEGQARALNNMGIIYKNFGEYDKAIACYTGNTKIYHELNDLYSLSQTYINIGNVYVYLGSYALALENFESAYTAASTVGRRREMAISLMNSGVIHNKMENYAKAQDYYHRSLKLAREINDTMQISNCLTNIGTNYIPMAEYDLAMKYIMDGLAIKEKLGDQRLISNSYNFLAEVYFQKGDFDHAIALDLKAIKLKSKIGDAEGLARCYNTLGRSYFYDGAPAIADPYADSALKYSIEIGALEQTVAAYALKKDIYASLARHDDAFRFAELHKQYSDSLMNENKVRAVKEIEMKYQSRMLEQENERLKLQSVIDADKLQKQRLMLYSIITLIVLLIAILILVIYFQRREHALNHVLRKKNELITRQNQKLDHLNRLKNKILSIITHDLRGKIGNQVVALSLLGNEEFKDEKERRDVFEKLGNSATISIELLENLVLWSKVQEKTIDFCPEEMNISELVDEVIEFFSQRLKRKAMTIENRVDEKLACHADRIMLTAVFRNLIGNAIKYSENRAHVEVTSGMDKGRVAFTVKDNGIGMDEKAVDELNSGIIRSLSRGVENEKGSGIGLSLIRELLRFQNGELQVKSEKGRGSEFTVILDCKRQA